ncbi:MAG: hypothetical protein C5B50_17440 [Verrucomicrobia bacterium]|nr:MAG: hypothetical protein C5B50_17440 [Verrucomicrobiota bacterium]
MEIYIRGKELPDSIIKDVLQVTYKDSINEIDSFTIEINNWDATTRTFKFVPPLKANGQDFTGIFDPGTAIEISMGYGKKNLRRMMKGQITSLAPKFNESGAPSLTVGGLNELHQFRTEQHTRSWQDGQFTDTKIATELCKAPLKKGQAGLGIDIETNPAPDEAAETFVFMNNQYDVVFLLERARRHGYEIYIKNGIGSKKPRLYFGLSENRALAPVYQLEWGKSLINFRPTLTTAKQVSTVTVRGWDRKSNSAIEASYTLEELWKKQNKSAREIQRQRQIAKAFGNRTEVVTDKPVHTKQEAKDLARSILEKQNKNLVEGTGSTVGLPDLRAGCALQIVGFGLKSDGTGKLVGASSDFDGNYYVTETTHTIGGDGYRTEFSARREGEIGNSTASA